MKFAGRLRWSWKISAWCSFGVAIAALVVAYLAWPPFDWDFWIELTLLIGGLASGLISSAMALFKSASPVKRWFGALPALLALGLLVGTSMGAVASYHMGASIESFRTRADRGSSHAQSNHLVYVRLKSLSTEPAYPIVYLAGGPPGSGILTLLGHRQHVFMAMREFGDVIALDQRGTMPWNLPWLMCPTTIDFPLDRPYDPQTSLEISGPYVRGCGQHYRAQGIDLRNFNTVENAEDLEDLRVHLGAEKITLWATSYGTQLAFAYLKQHPDRVHRAMLHGVEGPHQTLKLPSEIDAMFAEIARRAAADPGLHTPDLVGDLRDILARLDATPARVSVTVDGEPTTVTLGKYDIQLYTAQRLGSPWSSMALPAIVAEMKRGDFSRYAKSAIKARRGQRYPLMGLQMDCASGASAERQARVERERAASILGGALNDPFPGICRFVDAPDLGDEFRTLRSSDVPVLFVSGTLDGRTPVSNVEDILPFFPDHQHIVVDGAGHGDDLFHGSPQILQGMREFMRGEPVSVLNPRITRKFEAVLDPSASEVR